jgi:hypothetical protein
MSILNTLKERKDIFFESIPQLPMGRYVHFVLLRETESFPIFQTDGTLNVIRTGAGLEDNTSVISRLVMFKRKQSSPERLTGRELLRYHGIITDKNGNRSVSIIVPVFANPALIVSTMALPSATKEQKNQKFIPILLSPSLLMKSLISPFPSMPYTNTAQ